MCSSVGTSVGPLKTPLSHFSGPPCQPNPCHNGGMCVPLLSKFDCKCPPPFAGRTCLKVREERDAAATAAASAAAAAAKPKRDAGDINEATGASGMRAASGNEGGAVADDSRNGGIDAYDGDAAPRMTPGRNFAGAAAADDAAAADGAAAADDADAAKDRRALKFDANTRVGYWNRGSRRCFCA